MSAPRNDQTGSAPESGVSPLRKKISLGMLIVAVLILAIEARSGLGLMLSGKALAARSTDGAFEKVTFAEAQSLVAAFPKVSVYADHPDEIIYRYSWLSLLRTIAKKPVPELFIVASKADPPMAVAYFTDAGEVSRMQPVSEDDQTEENPAPTEGAESGMDETAEKSPKANEQPSEKSAEQ